MVQVGDSIPSVELAEGSPGNKVNLAQSLRGKGLIIGVPAAFSPGCSMKHIPGFMESARLPEAGQVYVVSVNDAFVMEAWGKKLDKEGKSKIHFLADATGAFTNALDLGFDATAILGNIRSKRYALIVDNGKITSIHVEPDNTGVNGKERFKSTVNSKYQTLLHNRAMSYKGFLDLTAPRGDIPPAEMDLESASVTARRRWSKSSYFLPLLWAGFVLTVGTCLGLGIHYALPDIVTGE